MTGRNFGLQFLESAENVKSAISRATNRTPNSDTARGIAICLQQGRMFFESAYAAPLEIRPLLFYYGMAAYAKAVVCAKGLKALTTLPESHGLSDVSAHNSRVADLRLKITGRGIFHEFNDAVSKSEYLAYFQGTSFKKHHIPMASSDHLEGKLISFKEILARSLHTPGLYEATFSEKAKVQAFDFQLSPNFEIATLQVVVTDQIESRESLLQIVRDLRARHDVLKEWRLVSASTHWDKTYLVFDSMSFDPANELSDTVFVANGNGFSTALFDSACRDYLKLFCPVYGGLSGGHPYFFAPIEGAYISEPSLHLMGMFLLSSLVRYRPQIWVHSLSRFSSCTKPADDQVLALVERFMETTASSFQTATENLLNERMS
jgi:hypothetical protein